VFRLSEICPWDPHPYLTKPMSYNRHAGSIDAHRCTPSLDSQTSASDVRSDGLVACIEESTPLLDYKRLQLVNCGVHSHNGYNGGTFQSDQEPCPEHTPARVLLTFLTHAHPSHLCLIALGSLADALRIVLDLVRL